MSGRPSLKQLTRRGETRSSSMRYSTIHTRARRRVHIHAVSTSPCAEIIEFGKSRRHESDFKLREGSSASHSRTRIQSFGHALLKHVIPDTMPCPHCARLLVHAGRCKRSQDFALRRVPLQHTANIKPLPHFVDAKSVATHTEKAFFFAGGGGGTAAVNTTGPADAEKIALPAAHADRRRCWRHSCAALHLRQPAPSAWRSWASSRLR